MRKPIVSVVIASHDGETFIKRCLYSLFAETNPRIEVIVVEDDSNFATQKILSKYFSKEPRLKYIRTPNQVGAAAARNIGVRNTTGNFILFLDNDTVIKSGWFDKIEPFFKRNPQTGAAQVKIITLNSRKYDSAGELLSPLGTLVERARDAQDTGQFEKEDLIFAGKTAGALARRHVFEQIGGFDEDFGMYWEDTDLFWRTWLSGWEVRFCPSIEVQHAYYTKQKALSFYNARPVTYYGCRNMIASSCKNLEAVSLIYKLPLVIGIWSGLALAFFLKGKFDRSFAITRGLYWNFTHIHQTYTKRKQIQAMRKITDKKLFQQITTKKKLTYYLGKGYAYLIQKPF